MSKSLSPLGYFLGRPILSLRPICGCPMAHRSVLSVDCGRHRVKQTIQRKVPSIESRQEANTRQREQLTTWVLILDFSFLSFLFAYFPTSWRLLTSFFGVFERLWASILSKMLKMVQLWHIQTKRQPSIKSNRQSASQIDWLAATERTRDGSSWCKLSWPRDLRWQL